MSKLVEQIMARRAANYGLPREQQRHILTDEEWVREELVKLRAMPAPVEVPRAPQMVYFIQTVSGEIKIGVAQNVAQRLAGLQTAHPVKLTLLTTVPGGVAAERAYHRQFAEHRLHGEWFAPHPDILAEIERLSSKGAMYG